VSSRRRVLAFAALATVCVAAALVSAAIAVVGAQHDKRASARAVAADRPKASQVLSSGKPFAVFRTLDRKRSSTYGRLTIAPLDGTTPGAPVLAGPSCQRVAFGAGHGLCLDVLGTQMAVEVLDSRMHTVHSFDLPGIPSRARVSPDGRWGGVTAFIVGHAYAAPGTFSTAATIVDLATGQVQGDLEKDYTVTDAGKVVDAVDRNFWGITFAGDGDTFYATLAANGKTWLIKGSIKARTAHTIHENVECPALSPDGTRIGYKQAVSHNPTTWRFHVLDLATGKDTPLAETRSVDDQLSWLDDQHLLYGYQNQVWVVNADGSGKPRVWLRDADSPTVQGAARPSS
jgi:hypothetical protein